MLPSLKIRRAGWQDLFIKRELTVYPTGADRYVVLVVKAIASCLGTFIISLGPLTSLIVKSQGFGVTGYGRMVGVAGLLAAALSLWAANLADRHSRVRLLLWGMAIAIVLMFCLSGVPDNAPAAFIVLFLLVSWTEAFAVVTVSALLRDFSPRTGRGFGVGLVTVGTISGNWGSAFLAGHFLDDAGTWQNMFRVFAFVCVGLWLIIWLFAREPSAGIRAQVIPSMKDVATLEANARQLETGTISNGAFWDFIRADLRLWLLALGQGFFLIGYITFVSYGPLLTELGFGQSPQDASSITSWVFLSIIVFLIVGGLVSDRLRIRKSMAFAFTLLSGAALIGLGISVGKVHSTGTIIGIYIVVGAMLAMMWSPTNALFSETAEDINSRRQTTAFGGQALVSRTVYQIWIFVAPTVIAGPGVRTVWYIAGAGALITAPILVMCRGTWGRFSVGSLDALPEAPAGEFAVPAVSSAPTVPATRYAS
jgi:MFS family permease